MSLNKSKVLRAAEKYVLQGKIPAAIDEYRKVVDADPADLTTINTLGDLYVRAGKIQDAITNFSRIADSYREGGFTLKAIAMLKKISKLDPTNVETAMKLANLYSQQGLLVEARQQYLQVADAYARAGQTRKALEAYQKIADLDPANTSVRIKLGEIYSREGMSEQAHEAFILAGAEFLRKGDVEQALTANLKALGINPESRQGLTAIATIYTQQGQIDRAINILCEAFERNPGDVELLTILGRTYLSAGLMDEAERTFLSLVELDRNRYHYLLEVGRRFLQIGNLDRAAEQIDGCLDVLIAKREEDKAIDFLRRALDRDMNHVGALKRLAQIFLRIREDHNLIATLNSLVEAAMRKGDDAEAIAALKELVRLEPDEQIHLQRLYTLGVRDIVEGDSPDVVRATGPLDFQASAFDETFVIRQISEAEILAGHGQVEHAVSILTEILVHTPENVQVHSKLKDIYLRAGIMDKAAAECLALARIHESRGESARASDFLAEARQLNPMLDTAQPFASSDAGMAFASSGDGMFGFDNGYDEAGGGESDNGDKGFELREPSGSLDWSKYQTGALADHTGFVTVPKESALSDNFAFTADESGNGSNGNGASPFRYSDTLIGDPNEAEAGDAPGSDMVFNSASLLPSDTMSRVLRDELEGIDFYIAQGYVEIARDTLDRLRDEHGDHTEILSRYKRLGVTVDEPQRTETESQAAPSTEPDSEQPHVGTVFLADLPQEEDGESYIEAAGQGIELTMSADVAEEDEAQGSGFDFGGQDELSVDVSRAPAEGERKNFLPFMIQKESGPLDADLMVQFNTSDLLNGTAFDPMKPPTGPIPKFDLQPETLQPAEQPEMPEWTEQPDALESAEQPDALTRAGTGMLMESELIDSIVSGIDSSFEGIQQHAEECLPAAPEVEAGAREALFREPDMKFEPEEFESPGPVVDLNQLMESEQGAEFEEHRDELQEIFEELRENTGALEPPGDFETHYSLGLAYKDMDLLDEAIEQFQLAFRQSGAEDLEGNYIQCCHLLGVCFKRKQMPKVAVMWFQRGLNIINRTEDEYQALRYEIGLCYEEMGDVDNAIDAFMEVYGIDVNYREAGSKIKQLQAAKNG